MRPRKPFPSSAIKELRALLAQAKGESQRQRIQAVLIRAVSDSPPDEIAKITGLTVHTIRTLHSRYMTSGIAALAGPGRGGARHRGLSIPEEHQLLGEFLDRARTGGIVVVQSIREEYERRLGRAVNRSTVYRLLARHDWRKITPRSRHPKQDITAQAAFKKSSSQS